MAGEDASFWTTIPGMLTALAGVLAAVASLVTAVGKSGLLRRGRGGADEPSEGNVAPPGAGGGKAPPAASEERPEAPAVTTLRSAPAVLSSAKVDAMLVRLDYFERRRNPSGKGVAHRYAARAIGDAVVVDDGATGLTWQKVASEDPMTFDKATAWVDDLNGRRWAGFTDWRLPTAEEAMSLMEPDPADDFHIARAFSRGGNFIWTADRPPDGGGWVVYFYDAILVSESERFNAWVRAVR